MLLAWLHLHIPDFGGVLHAAVATEADHGCDKSFLQIVPSAVHMDVSNDVESVPVISTMGDERYHAGDLV